MPAVLEFYAAQEDRIRRHAARIELELAAVGDGEGEESRGKARPIIRPDFSQYPSVSAAARETRVKPDWICQAIRRAGTCGGFRWAYIDAIPDNFFDVRPGAACPWPYRFGNPTIYPKGDEP